MWVIISIVTAVTITAVITVGAYYYRMKKKRITRRHEGQQQLQLQRQRQQTSSRKFSETTDYTTPASARIVQINSSDTKLTQNVHKI